MYDSFPTDKFACSCVQWEGCQFFVFRFDLAPTTTNAERAGNRFARADFTKNWRTMGFVAARNLPKASWLSVIVEPFQEKGRLQDVGACNPSVKAVIDGIVDAKVIPDDSADFVKEIRFLPATRSKNGLVVKLVLMPKNP